MSAISRKCYLCALPLRNAISRCLSRLARAASLVLITLAIVIHSSAHAQTNIRVDGQNGSANPAGQGSGWGSDAYLFLQDGLARANTLLSGGSPPSHVNIWVRGAQGSGLTYYPDEGTGQTNGLETSHFALRFKVSILGNFIGTGGSADTRDPSYLTILSADIDQDSTLDADNAYHVVRAPTNLLANSNNTPHIDGCIIKFGYATVSNNEYGGGIHIGEDASPYIRKCTITGNQATQGGGGIYCGVDSDAIIRLCNITSNEVRSISGEPPHPLAGWGGGIYIDSQATPILITSLIEGNDADTGGGIMSWDQDDGNVDNNVQVINCRILSNVAVAAGGGVFSYGPSGDNIAMNFVNCVIAGNSCSNTAGYGGGINFTKTLPGMVNCTIADNTAWRGGRVRPVQRGRRQRGDLQLHPLGKRRRQQRRSGVQRRRLADHRRKRRAGRLRRRGRQRQRDADRLHQSRSAVHGRRRLPA